MDFNTLFNQYRALFSWHLSRLKCFWQIIFGMICAQSVQQHQCALGFSGAALIESKCRRIRSFLADFTIDFCEVAVALMYVSGLQGPVDLVLDRTNWSFGKTDHNLLVLSVVISDTFSFPLFWVALPKKGASNYQERIDLLQLFVDTFGVQRIRSLIADREFIGEEWLTYLTQHKISFFIRIKQNRLVEGDEDLQHIGDFFTHLEVGKKRTIQATMQGFKLFFAGTRSKEGELVIVITNKNIGVKALSLYKKRWTIESMFKHAKTNGLFIEETQLKDPKRFEKLLAAVSFALLLSFLFGKKQEKIKKTPFRKSVNAPLFSTFRRGFDALRQIFFSKNRNLCEAFLDILPNINDFIKYQIQLLTKETKIIEDFVC